MILLDRTVTIPTYTTPVSLFPFACVHEDNDGHSSSTWARFLDEVKNTPHGYAIGLGDYMDWLRTHAREFLDAFGADGKGAGRQNSFGKLHDWRRKKADEFCEKYLAPLGDKLIGLSLGNHHHLFGDGLNDTMYMCQQLKVPYLGHGFWIRLKVAVGTRRAHGGSSKTFRILGHHGEGIGGGATMGGDINAMENKSKDWKADIYIFAHNHKKGGFHKEPVTIPLTGALRLIDEPAAFIRAGCFVRGYVENCVTYAESKGLMNPTAIGYVRLDIKLSRPTDENGKSNMKHRFELTY